MKNLFKDMTNSVLGLGGLAVARKETVARSGQIAVLEKMVVGFINDMEELCRASVFPDLPTREGRHELMVQHRNIVSRVFCLANYLNKALEVPGDICEFGVAYGATSAIFANEILGTERHLWLFDSFEGLSKPTEKDVLINDIAGLGSIDKYAGVMAHTEEEALHRVTDLGFPRNRLHIVPGFIEESIRQRTDLPRQVSFAFVDFDFYEPILTALRFLEDRVPRGGFILVDDYGYFSAGAKTATDEFVASAKGKFTLSPAPPFIKGIAILSRAA